MKRPYRLLLWALFVVCFVLTLAAAIRAGEGQLVLGVAGGFFAAVVTYLFYPLPPAAPGSALSPGPAPIPLPSPARGTLKGLDSDEPLLDVVLNSMGEGVILLNHLGRLVLMNPSARKILGLSEKEGLGRHYLEVIRHPVLPGLLDLAEKEGGIAGGEIEFSGNEEKTFTVGVAVLRGTGDRPLGKIVVFSDITSLKKLMRMRTDFAANVSHELKTPLTAILGYVETLLAGALDDKKNRAQFLKKISAQAQRLHALISDVLLLSQIESGAYLDQAEPVDLSEVCQQAVELLKAKSEAKGIRIVQETDASPKALAQKEGLFHVLENLLDNAVKYSPAKSRVRIAAKERADGRMELTVEDEGPGIPEEAQSRVFERFFRVDAARNREAGGTGLGLSIVKHLVERMRGEIELQSRPGQGSLFRVILPKA